MQMDIKSIERTVNMLAGSLHQRMDFNNFASGTKKLLIVEGQTDKHFICSHLYDDVICVIANKAFGINNGFNIQSVLNCKKAIIEVVYGLSVYPTVIKCPEGSEKWKVFGMIDMDFDDVYNHKNIAKLFITDTHDLETLMLSTEKNLFQKIEGCVIKDADTEKALFMAYQLGKMRNLCIGHISLESLSTENDSMKYSSFFNDKHQISLKDLISYLNEKATQTISPAKENKLFEQLSKDRSIRKYLKEGIWRSGFDAFKAAKPDDLWNVVNGHDILSLLRYLNKDIEKKYIPKHQLDRAFEMDLINAYNPNNFKKTKICKRMVAEGIVKA